jgi:hypothetical protein
MKISLVLFSLFLLGFSNSLIAQTSAEESEAIINLLGVQKKQLVAQLVQLPAADSSKFWSVYSEFEEENKKNGKQRLALYEKTVQSYSNLDNKIADSLANQFFAQRMNQEKLLEKYFNKMKAATNPVIAFQFYQAETYLLTALRSSIIQQIPTYGQIVPKK